MNDQYRLGRLGNSELLAGLSTLVRQSNELTAQVLAHLVELEERMLHLELGFASLFSYCVEALGMSEGAAGRRVAAARVCRRFSGAFERVARGQLHLCARHQWVRLRHPQRNQAPPRCPIHGGVHASSSRFQPTALECTSPRTRNFVT